MINPVISQGYQLTTNNANITVTNKDAYISAMAIVVTGAGSAWTITVQDFSGTPLIIYSSGSAVVGNTYINLADHGILMKSGINILTGGTTAGTAYAFVTYGPHS